MKAGSGRKTFLVFAAMVLVLSVSIISSPAQGKGQAGGGRLEGSWNVRVTVRDCTTSAEIRSFDALTQFMQGGTVIDSNSFIWQASKTPGQGIWEHTTGNSYRFTFKAFGFSPAGVYTGYQIVRHVAQLDPSGDSYESAGTAEVYTPAGVQVATLCSTTTATRMTF